MPAIGFNRTSHCMKPEHTTNLSYIDNRGAVPLGGLGSLKRLRGTHDSIDALPAVLVGLRTNVYAMYYLTTSQDYRMSRVPSVEGLQCPFCECRRSLIRKTLPTAERIIRHHKCLGCSLTYQTVEVVDNDDVFEGREVVDHNCRDVLPPPRQTYNTAPWTRLPGS